MIRKLNEQFDKQRSMQLSSDNIRKWIEACIDRSEAALDVLDSIDRKIDNMPIFYDDDEDDPFRRPVHTIKDFKEISDDMYDIASAYIKLLTKLDAYDYDGEFS